MRVEPESHTRKRRAAPALLVGGLLPLLACAPAPGEDGVQSELDTAARGPCDSPDPAWIWCDDFERDRLDRYFEHDDAGGSFVRRGGVGVDGSFGMRARFARGQVDAGSLRIAFGETPQDYFRPVDRGVERHREIYWRFRLRLGDGWTGGGGDKLTRATSFVAEDSWAQSMIAHVWSGSSPWELYLVADPASGIDRYSGLLRTDTYNDFDELAWLGATRGGTPVFDAAHVGRWMCIETHVRLNRSGSSDGVFRVWLDGEPLVVQEGLNWIGPFRGYGVNAVFLENYWNAGSPRAQERYFDDFVVSTEPIGCAQ